MQTTYEDNSLRRYLLGHLPEAETERFDELSFTDETFGTRLQTVEDDLIDAYLQGELSHAEAQHFQTYYLASPRRREKVQFAQALHIFADQQIVARARPAATPTVEASDDAAPPVEPTPSWWRRLFTLPPLTLQFGLAGATALLLLASGWFFWETLRLRGQMETAQTARVALEQRARELQAQIEQQESVNTKTREQLTAELQRTQQQLAQLQQQQELAQARTRPPLAPREPNLLHLELTPQTRTGSAAAPLRIPAKTDFVILQLVIEDDDFQSHQVELRTQADDLPVWKSGKLNARLRDASKVLDVRVRRSLVPAGSYVVKLQGISPNGQITDLRKYSFTVGKS